MLTPKELAEIRERGEKLMYDPDPNHGVLTPCPEKKDGCLVAHFQLKKTQTGEDLSLLFTHIEELTTGYAKEVEENAALKKENRRLRDVILRNIITFASDRQLNEILEKPSEELTNFCNRLLRKEPHDQLRTDDE